MEAVRVVEESGVTVGEGGGKRAVGERRTTTDKDAGGIDADQGMRSMTIRVLPVRSMTMRTSIHEGRMGL